MDIFEKYPDPEIRKTFLSFTLSTAPFWVTISPFWMPGSSAFQTYGLWEPSKDLLKNPVKLWHKGQYSPKTEIDDMINK